MPEGKEIQFSEGEYPELDGLENGAMVDLKAQCTLKVNEDGTKSLVLDSVSLQTESHVDKELRQMKGEEADSGAGAGGKEQESYF